jgi:DNA-binding winged helix-turn-helix (wHTH) protein
VSLSIRFANAEIRPSERQVLIDGKPAALGSRAFDVLLALVERRERLVGKNELLDLVWPESARFRAGPAVAGHEPGAFEGRR